MDYIFPIAIIAACILLPAIGAAAFGVPGIFGAWLLLRWLGRDL